ncbi:MAG: TIM barrel protein [Fibrobacteria bacterium]|nr:TIM barrel protein [Fibrobacteria bacterium]
MTINQNLRIGNQSAWSAESVLQPFFFAFTNRFNAFEWFPDKQEDGSGWDVDDIDRTTRQFIKNIAKASDLNMSLHLPWDYNPSDLQKQYPLSAFIRFAKDTGCGLINLHLQHEHIEAYTEAIIPVIKSLKQAGILTSLENTVSTSPELINSFFRMLWERAPEIIGHCGLCLDIGHANLSSSTKNNYLGFIDTLSSDIPIIHCHLHENFGDADSHLTLFTGPSRENPSGIKGVIERLQNRNYTGVLILEQWPDPPSLLNQARIQLEDILKKKSKKKEVVTPSPKHSISDLAEADTNAKNWLQKLKLAESILSKQPNEITKKNLGSIAIYLQLVGSGKITVQEDGGHQRPSRHAAVSKRLFELLQELSGPDNLFIIRKILPWLPSFKDCFTCAEPLTLIRDIAHRGDIPKDLKHEIKTTLQNKLHRSAGPEDLVTANKLLNRIKTDKENFPASFLQDFTTFYRQLEDFFNVQSLDTILSHISESLKPQKHYGSLLKHISTFLKRKRSTKSMENAIKDLQALTALRKEIHPLLKKSSSSDSMDLYLADIGLEEYCFSLCSRIINLLDKKELQTHIKDYLLVLDNLVIGFSLNGLDTKECIALSEELSHWQKDFNYPNTDWLLRTKATLERCRRLITGHAREMLTLFPGIATEFEQAFKLPHKELKFFTEDGLRRNLVFQGSKIIDLLDNHIRGKAGLSPWDIIVPGNVSGTLIQSDNLLSVKDHKENLIVITPGLDGDAEIPSQIKGIISITPIPHLSHVAIRARQAHVVLASIEQQDSLRELDKYRFSRINVNASNIEVIINQDQKPVTPEKYFQQSLSLPQVKLCSTSIPLSEVTKENAGPKANNIRLLTLESKEPNAGFKVPLSYVLPFGMLQHSLEYSEESGNTFSALLAKGPENSKEGIREYSRSLKGLIKSVQVSDKVITTIRDVFKNNTRLMVRSSALGEDEQSGASAGLYKSLANIDYPQLLNAITSVWASLWSTRAIRYRLKYGISEKEAQMAILIQEMPVPDYSFIIHTHNPLTNNKNECYVEVAPGLGEILTSGNIQGTPYRFRIDKTSRALKTLTFANYSQAFSPASSSGIDVRTLNYSREKLSTDVDFRNEIISQLARLAIHIESVFGGPQDIEGLLESDIIYLVQTRPQVIN